MLGLTLLRCPKKSKGVLAREHPEGWVPVAVEPKFGFHRFDCVRDQEGLQVHFVCFRFKCPFIIF